MAIFQQLNKDGVTVLIVTHEADIAEHTKRIITFADGWLTSDVLVDNPLDAHRVLEERKKILAQSMSLKDQKGL